MLKLNKLINKIVKSILFIIAVIILYHLIGYYIIYKDITSEDCIHSGIKLHYELREFYKIKKKYPENKIEFDLFLQNKNSFNYNCLKDINYLFKENDSIIFIYIKGIDNIDDYCKKVYYIDKLTIKNAFKRSDWIIYEYYKDENFYRKKLMNLEEYIRYEDSIQNLK